MNNYNVDEYEYYRDTFKEAQENHTREANKLDKIIVLISFGSIALSVNFIFNTGILFKDTVFIALSWIFFILTIILNLISLIFSQNRFWLILENLEKWARDDFRPKKFSTNTFHSKYIKLLNFGSYISLIIAIILLTIFGIKNLKYENIAENKNIIEQEKENKTINNVLQNCKVYSIKSL